jgi:hypothetical protein
MNKWKIRRIQRQISPGYPIWEFDWYACNGEYWLMAPTFAWLCASLERFVRTGEMP